MNLNPDTLAILAAMQNGDTDSIQQMLSQSPGVDERTRALLEMAGNAGAANSRGDERARVRKRMLLRRAQSVISSLRDQLESAVRIIDLVAEATGACADCFGQDQECPDCRGRGTPGWLRPDPALYESLIAPIVKPRSAERAAESALRRDATTDENHPT